MKKDIFNKKGIVSVILPTFNERKNILSILNQLLDLALSREIELIVVDDNSDDGTPNIVRKYSKKDRRVRLISRIGRSGLSSAIKEGCLCASGEFIFVMDSDGQHKVDNLKLAMRKLVSRKIDLVVGSRFLKDSVLEGLTEKRKSGSTIANKFARLSLPKRYSYLTDYMSGFIAFKRNSCINLIEKIDVNGFKFFYELLALSKGSLSIIEIPLEFKERKYGSSKLDPSIIWDFLISLIHTFSKRIIPRRAISFAIVGLSGVFVQMFVIYFLILVTKLNFQQVLPFGIIMAASSNYTINNHLTFRVNKLKGFKFLRGLIKFLLVSSLPIVANIGVTNLFYSQFSSNTFFSQLAGIIVVFIWNYAASSKFVWNF